MLPLLEAHPKMAMIATRKPVVIKESYEEERSSPVSNCAIHQRHLKNCTVCRLHVMRETNTLLTAMLLVAIVLLLMR